MRHRSPVLQLAPAVLLAVVFTSALALAEDVVLKNGRVFRGVVATVDNGMVHIEMPGGALGFPVSAVLRIDASSAAYRQYMERRAALRGATATATQWLDLAQWAKAQGLDGAAREAALAAARLEPQAPGLQALLGELGFVFDREQGAYLPFEEEMARQGRVFYAGAWVTSAERAAREGAAADARERTRARREALAAEEPADSAVAEARGDDSETLGYGIPLGTLGSGYYGSPVWVPGFGRHGGRPNGGMPGGGLRPPSSPSPCPACAPPVPAPRPEPAKPTASSARREWATPAPPPPGH